MGDGGVDLWWPHWCSLLLGSMCDGFVCEKLWGEEITEDFQTPSICDGHIRRLYYWGRSVMVGSICDGRIVLYYWG